MTAYQWGRKAYDAGTLFTQCPYPTGCLKAYDWRAGWVDAKRDDDYLSVLKRMMEA